MGGGTVSRAVGGGAVGADERGVGGVGEDLGGEEEWEWGGGRWGRRVTEEGGEGGWGLDWGVEREGRGLAYLIEIYICGSIYTASEFELCDVVFYHKRRLLLTSIPLISTHKFPNPPLLPHPTNHYFT